MIDALSGVAESVRTTANLEHGRRFLNQFDLSANSWLVFDKAQNVYHQFAK